MKIECAKEQLGDAVAVAERVAGKHPTLPILNCVLLSVQSGMFKIRATNLELGIEVEVPAKISSEGVVAVPAATLLNTLLNTYTQSITLELKEKNLFLQTPTGKTLIATVPVDDFPTLPTITGKSLKLNANELLKEIKTVWYAASTSAVKPELGSIYIYPEGNSLVFVATDSFRLAEKIIPTKGMYEFKPLLLPLRAIPELLRVLERAEGEVVMRVTDHQISFSVDSLYFTSRIIDGTFPDYRQIIPKETHTEVVVLKQDFLAILKKTAVFSGKFNQVNVAVAPKKKQCIISAHSDLGETTDMVSGEVEGEDIAINFNLKYLTDCFQGIVGDSLSLSFSGMGKPLVIRDAADKSFLYLVMPMNR